MKKISLSVLTLAALTLSACASPKLQEVRGRITQPVQPGDEIRYVNTDYSTFLLHDANAEMAMLEASACTVYFDVDSASIRADQVATIDRCAQQLGQNPQARLVLEGHADVRGSDRHNLKLGEQRARAVQRELTQRGVPAEQVQVATLGEKQPVVPAKAEAEHAKNRRVEFSRSAPQQ